MDSVDTLHSQVGLRSASVAEGRVGGLVSVPADSLLLVAGGLQLPQDVLADACRPAAELLLAVQALNLGRGLVSCSLTDDCHALLHAGPSLDGAHLRFWRTLFDLDALGSCVSSPVVRGAGAGVGAGASAGGSVGGIWYGMCVVWWLSVDCLVSYIYYIIRCLSPPQLTTRAESADPL